MSILNWNKPVKVASSAEHIATEGFDGGPAGGYVPNMSEEDKLKWKAKLVGKTTNHPQVEIRKSFDRVQFTMIVSLGNGYTYKYYKPDVAPGNYYHTKGVNVHIAANGGVQMTFDQMSELQQAVQEAKEVLETLAKNKTSLTITTVDVGNAT